ncbi:MAG: PhoH family protein, partial [Luteococcus sp.]|nr:PhoH family protein [Luteococcus sp.]
IAFCNLTNRDVVRHKLVGRIVAAYDQWESTDEVQQAFDRPNRATRRSIQ